ncbi:superoxide dismutase family protein [Bartonella krasnovii]|uniref:Superoxide dismutase [Cu-Zn] n=1 Tax=Bartonella krasnovii TaxID=2267275 RepID=A0A5B9D0U2_9HYPH|nr:superoxide dismutase family protein [Bartonella krasnovii]QEE12203.1 superoxide dismutase family protein [Bartonella krasnovii]UNF29862.1 superoxide dismutase family protein [Bartonella krasnovii]UNF36223.1 superoxide dismutase family protein [Bartonella krasnovii]UNF37926.1 superoxide dismutase family protein [Bartonella krasnovii]UNF43055.1 superoxide dismutase family protein [Bartonella krasnovii]
MKKVLFSLFVFMAFLIHKNFALALSTTVNIYKLENNNSKKPIGSIKIEESTYGLVFIPSLSTLPEGMHGFHVHENPSCDTKEGVIGGSAGGHYDPEHTGKHLGPYNVDGHLGDLPALYADKREYATMSVIAPRLKKISEITGRSLIIHLGGDNQSDKPLPLGGGGARLACGVIE